MSSVETIRGRETRVDQFDGESSAVIARAEAALALIGIERVYGTVALMKADTALLDGDRVRTLGYYANRDAGEAIYDIVTLAAHGGAPDGYGSHLLANGLVAAIRHDGNYVKAEQYGVTEGAECSARWQEAFYTAADMADDGNTPVTFTCKTSFLTKDTLWMSKRNLATVKWITVDHPAEIKATTGGNLEASVFATSTPIIHFRLNKSDVTFGNIDCNRLCSGILVRGGSATKVYKPNIVRFQRYGYFVCDGVVGSSADGGNGNHALLYGNIKQWEQSDPEFDNPADTQWTADCLVVGHKDWFAVGCTSGWSRVALLLLDMSVGNGTGAGNTEGRNIYCGYKSGGCGDFFGRGLHLMQGRPPDDGGISFPRLDNRAVGGPINIECWNQTNKCYLVDTDWDSGTGQFYGHRIVLDGVSLITGGQNRKDDRIALFDPMARVYARADATNPAGFELGQNNNVTVGFFPFEGNVWAGDYAAINYDGRQRSPGNTGPVNYIGEWNAETATVFPTTATMEAFWLVRTNTHGSTVTFAGQSFTDGDLLFPLVSTPSTTVYAANWFASMNGQVEMLLRGVQARQNPGERHVQGTTTGVPYRSFYSPSDSLLFEWDVAGVKATHEWDGALWQYTATNIQIKNWKFESGGDLQPIGDGTQTLGSISARIETVITNGVNVKGTVADGINILGGTGSPEGVVTAGRGCLYLRDDGGAGTTIYIKESGAGNTGWVGK